MYTHKATNYSLGTYVHGLNSNQFVIKFSHLRQFYHLGDTQTHIATHDHIQNIAS